MLALNMSAPHPNTGVLDLDYDLLQDLQVKLQENGAWKLLATATGLFSEGEIIKMAANFSPSYKLLTELHNKLCTVAVLCHILDNCQLYDALALLKEPEPIDIIVQPGNGEESAYVRLGGELQLECQAKGLPPPQYLWYHGNVELPDQTSPKLCVPNFNIANEGDYYCCISQSKSAGSSEVYTSTVTVNLLPECPYIVEQPPARSCYEEGNEISLKCLAHAHPLPEYQWFLGNTQLDGQSSYELIINKAKLYDKGNYKCYVYNKGGVVWSDIAVVDVIPRKSRSKATEKVALLIANDKYKQLTPLLKPTNDVALLSEKLSKLGYKVIALRNMTLIEMKNAIQMFCRLLPEGAYGLFYFAGHGFEMQDKFMLPVNAPGIDSFLRSDSLCEKEVIRDVLATKPELFVVLLDMCLRIPDIAENPSIHNESPELIAYSTGRNLIQGYATSMNKEAYERKTETNGIYVKYLKELIMEDIPISEILKRVGQAIAMESPEVSNQQMPSRAENVVNDYYFNDEVIGNSEIEAKFQSYNYLPQDTRIWFENVACEAFAKFCPYRKHFHNVLEIRMTNVDAWKVTCEIPCQEKKQLGVKLTQERIREDQNYLIITVHNLQKLKSPLMLTISLIDPTTDKLVDNGALDLEMPLIAAAHLWFQQQSEHSESITS